MPGLTREQRAAREAAERASVNDDRIRALEAQNKDLQSKLDDLAGKLTEATKPSLQGFTPAQVSLAGNTVGADRRVPAGRTIENLHYEERSVFAPEGVSKKPALAHNVFFCGIRQNAELLTPREIDLFNRFKPDGKNLSTRGGKFTARFEGPEDQRRLLIDVPATTTDQRMALPQGTSTMTGLEMILSEILDGEASMDPSALNKQIETLQRQVDELQAGRSGPDAAP